MNISIIAIAVLILISGGRLYFVKDFGNKMLSVIEVIAEIIILVTTQIK